MTKQIKILQARLKLHYTNYDQLKREELYQAHKYENRPLSNDELDYLLTQAVTSMPQHAAYIPLDLAWNLLNTINKVLNIEDATDPQISAIEKIIKQRELFDIDNNWHRSVIHIYELIMEKNLANIHADLQVIKILKNEPELTAAPKLVPNQTKSLATKPLLFVHKTKQTADVDPEEKCCNWLTLDYTTPFFFY